MGKEILRVENLTKIYPGGTVANYKINFSADEGEIHALVGENGAGKSTLMKMLFGIEEVTDGKIFLRGEEIHFANSTDAIAHGIGMVQQHMMLVPSLTVAENLVLGIEHTTGLFVDKKQNVKDTEEISEKYNLKVDADKLVRDISIGMKQKLEILKTMYRGAKIIILDEPTAVLAPQETEELFEQLLNLKKDGYTILFISHKLNEVKYLCDRLTVLKDGKSIGTYNVSDVTVEEISNLMVGRDITLSYDKDETEIGDKILTVDHLNFVDKFGTKKLDDLSFSLRSGEVLGIAGIEGNGQKEAMEILTGNMKCDSGSIQFKGKDLTKLTIGKIRDTGIAHVPEDRNLDGSAPQMSVRDNISAASLKKFTNKFKLLDQKKIDEYCEESVEKFKVKTSGLNSMIKSLSGGNVQKAIVAREFTQDADVIVLNQPTRGVDVGAMEFIHKKILEMRSQKKSMVMVSADLAELQALSDRIIVFYKGKVVGVIDDVKQTTDKELGLYMLGLKQDSKEKLMEA
ncbi:MAG: ABC transporter ATP-binding protein [Lachnospiraceae bacterium]|nr:ABC transporter ATP-binding protein [Lachnospiraceae bacterium]